MENAEKLTNAKIIMDDCNVDKAIQEQVCDAINNIEYSKRLKTLEGKIVSDVDMCDALGANGILRVYTYSMKNGKPFFDRNIFPIEDMNAEKYTRKCADSSVCHIFEKILKKFEKSVDIFCRKSIILSCSPEKTTNTTTEKESLKNGFEKKI